MSLDLEKYRLPSLLFYELLNTAERRFVKENISRKEYKKGQVIMRKGSYSQGVYIVRKGKVKIHNSNPDGKESIIYFYKKGEYFGYRPLLAKEVNPVTATAMENVVVTFLAKDVFLNLLDKSPSLARNLLASMAGEFTVWINKITVFSNHAVKERTALALLILAKVYADDSNPTIKPAIDIGRDDLAAYIGTAKETVVRMLRVFKDAGIISSRGTRISITDPTALHDYLTFF